MENYTEEEKKQYNDYWNYYYGTQDHDYYADCMNQSYATEHQVLQGEGQTGQGQKSGNGDQITGKENQTEEGTKGDKKKGKKRKGAAQQERPEGNLFYRENARPPDKSAYWKTIFFISHPKHMLWVLKRTVSISRFFWAPKIHV